MRYYIFESGSKGNSTLIASKGKYLLIDDGISIRKFKGYLLPLLMLFWLLILIQIILKV